MPPLSSLPINLILEPSDVFFSVTLSVTRPTNYLILPPKKNLPVAMSFFMRVTFLSKLYLFPLPRNLHLLFYLFFYLICHLLHVYLLTYLHHDLHLLLPHPISRLLLTPLPPFSLPTPLPYQPYHNLLLLLYHQPPSTTLFATRLN
ncbi:unnamed protein product [Prunus brigantina]